MKTLILIFMLFVSAEQNYYCEGWDDGYQNGWCYGDLYCIPPIPPVCPIPRIGESYSNYQQGYNRGFKEGYEDRNE